MRAIPDAYILGPHHAKPAPRSPEGSADKKNSTEQQRPEIQKVAEADVLSVRRRREDWRLPRGAHPRRASAPLLPHPRRPQVGVHPLGMRPLERDVRWDVLTWRFLRLLGFVDVFW